MKTALIIEDNQDNMVLITRLLEKAGYRALQAETGMQGFEMAIQNKPDFILLDIQLPDMNGVEVLTKIRAVESCTGIQIIAITSYAMAGDRAKLLSNGCNGYIEKPVDPGQIINQIKSVIGETV